MAKIGFIGMGNMGSAILNGLLRVYKPEDLLFTAAHKEKMEAVTAKTGAQLFTLPSIKLTSLLKVCSK